MAYPSRLTGFERLVAHACPHQGRLPRCSVLARGSPFLRPALNDRRMASLGVVGAVGADAGQRFIGWYLSQQLGQHGRTTCAVFYAVVGDLDGSNLQRVGINAQVHLAPLPPVLGPMLLAFPFTFAQELDPGAVDQQVQWGGAGLVGQLHPQRLLASAHGTKVGHAPVQARQAQQTFNCTQALAQGQVEQTLDAQVELDGCLREDPLTSSLAAGQGVPLHVFVQPNRQRPSSFERSVVHGPVGGLVACLGALGFSHAKRLPAQRRASFVQQSL